MRGAPLCQATCSIAGAWPYVYLICRPTYNSYNYSAAPQLGGYGGGYGYGGGFSLFPSFTPVYGIGGGGGFFNIIAGLVHPHVCCQQD